MADLTKRETYSIDGSWGDAPPWFQHTLKPGKPGAPTLPDGLDAGELAQLNAWLARIPVIGFDDTEGWSVAAAAKAAAFKTYLTSPEYLAWESEDKMNRDSQWRWRRADVHDGVGVSGVVPMSSDPAGVGDPGTLPSDSFPPSAN